MAAAAVETAAKTKPPAVDARTVRVRTSHTIRHPFVKPLILRAVEQTRYPGTMPWSFYDELVARIAAPDLGVFLGIEGRQPKAVAVALLPSSAMMIAPQVTLAYSGGKPVLARLVGKRLREWLVSEGYDRVLGLNLYRQDAVFMRGFRHIGTPRRLGSVIEWVLS